jgi:Fur family peroxide stress response transcriptional regulator
MLDSFVRIDILSQWNLYKLKEKIESAFRANGLRCTPQRFFVMEHLMRHPVHATAEDIYIAVNSSDPRASRATVYNNLHALERAGLVREVSVDSKAVRFDANVDRHHHFICDACGLVEDIEWFDPPKVHFHVRDFEVKFRGTCDVCRRTKNATSKTQRQRSN